MTIQDEFTSLPLTKRRKHQLRRRKAGLCRKCQCKRVAYDLCLFHYAEYLDKQRVKLKTKKPYGSKILKEKVAK